MDTEYFDVPVVLFIFKRSETVIRILNVLKNIRPSRLYLIGDGPRNESERKIVDNARKKIESAVSWKCEIIRDYAKENRGVYENIAEGAKRVLKKEGKAIFLEDDNLPEETFFPFCKEMLEKYETNDDVLWICGTNYLEQYKANNDESYVFTKHLMPCGWASWDTKFSKYYDGDLKCLDKPETQKHIKDSYTNKALYRQQMVSAGLEKYRKESGLKYASWDFQMAISIRSSNLYGICPSYNQIKNIGVDSFSTHGGSSFENEMTRRFCGIESYPLNFPLVHPHQIVIDTNFEKKVDKIILFPFKLRLKDMIATIIKRAFGLSRYDHFSKENIQMKWKKRW